VKYQCVHCYSPGGSCVGGTDAVQEEGVARTTRTEQTSDGGRTTTTTTTTTHKTKGQFTLSAAAAV